jgi:hypothetical protein
MFGGGDSKLRPAAAGHWLSGKSGLVIAPAAVPAPFAASSPTCPSTATAPIAARSTASSREAGPLGASFVDGQRSAFEALTVESADGTLRVFTFYQLDKSESAWLAADFVANHHGRGYTKTGIRHELAERTVSSAMRQIPYIKLSHSILH